MDWQLATFGPLEPGTAGAERAYERVCEEWTELEETHPRESAKNIDEAADIVITLAAYVGHLGDDLARAVERKMAINRARKWIITEDGCGYHVKDRNDVDP